MAGGRSHDFNPRSPHGERLPLFVLVIKSDVHFNPRSPHGERQLALDAGGVRTIFQPTLPARGATCPYCGTEMQCDSISTHAPRTGSDANSRRMNLSTTDFNPRSPHGERRTAYGSLLRGCNFNPRSPHGERRDLHPRRRNDRRHFNPRSPHGERHIVQSLCVDEGKFQPTLPARGATSILVHGV